MFILHFLPDALILWICNIVLLAGVLLTVTAFFIKRIPVINQYRIPAQVLGIALLVMGVYWRGGYAIEMEWRERVAEVEARVAAAEAASKEENIKIVTKVVTKTQVIRTRGADIVKYVDREIVKYDESCKIPKEFVDAHNKAAQK
jgi:energy-coupling factor transporter transmembrane protein EcfT